jgi:hypothetical protein
VAAGDIDPRGPVSSADGPFASYKWKPRGSAGIQKVQQLCDVPSGLDHPICPLRRGNVEGLLIICDGRNPARVKSALPRALDAVPALSLIAAFCKPQT